MQMSLLLPSQPLLLAPLGRTMNEHLRLRETSGLPASEPSGCSPHQAESPESLAWKCWLVLFRSWGPLQQGAGAGLKLNILEKQQGP